MERVTFLQSAQAHLKLAIELEQAKRVLDAATECRTAVGDILYWHAAALDDNRKTE